MRCETRDSTRYTERESAVDDVYLYLLPYQSVSETGEKRHVDEFLEERSRRKGGERKERETSSKRVYVLSILDSFGRKEEV